MCLPKHGGTCQTPTDICYSDSLTKGSFCTTLIFGPIFGRTKTLWSCIHNTLFSWQLTNRPNKLGCLSLASLYSIVLCNSSLLDQFVSYEKMKCYEYGPRLLLLAKNIYVSELGLAKFKLGLEKIFIRDKHASLLRTSVNYSRKKFKSPSSY